MLVNAATANVFSVSRQKYFLGIGMFVEELFMWRKITDLKDIACVFEPCGVNELWANYFGNCAKSFE